MDSKTYIYKITNLIDNNKIYIGQTIEPNARWYKHKKLANSIKKPQYIHRAMDKYGVDNFVFEIIATCLNQKDADEIEEQLINQYNSRDKNYGYNIKPGGATRKGFKQSEETKQKMSDEWYLYHSIEDLKKMQEANRGRPCSEDRKQKIAAANKGKQFCLSHKQPQEVIDKRVASIAAKYGDKKCNAPDCDRTDGYKLNGARYCTMHCQRLMKTGCLELQKRPAPPNKGVSMPADVKQKISQARRGQPAHNKGKPHTEETIQKLRELNLGKEPPNKMQFTKEQISSILSDTRSLRKVAQDLGVSITVISRIKKQYA